MAAEKGRGFVLKRGTAAAGTLIAGMRITSFRLNQNPVDVTTKDSAGWRELLAGVGIRSMQIQAAGVFQDSTVEDQLVTDLNASVLQAYAIVLESGDTFEGSFLVADLSREGGHDGEVSYSLTLESSGAITYVNG